jgi:hypothetical protein
MAAPGPGGLARVDGVARARHGGRLRPARRFRQSRAGGIALGGPSRTALGADARSSTQDVAILNLALTLECLEAESYRQAVAGNALSGDMRSFAQIVAGHEAARVAFLQKALGSRAVASPTFDFRGIPTNPAKFLATAVSLEDTGVAAQREPSGGRREPGPPRRAHPPPTGLSAPTV